MKYTVVGLGNPGAEYQYTRHNVGRLAVESFAIANDYAEFTNDKKSKSALTKGMLRKQTVTLLLPNTFMNKTGNAVQAFVSSIKSAERILVIQDDIDLPFGTIRISFGRGSGGHKGIESVIRAIKTKNFIRVRIGVTPMTPTKKLKKLHGEQKVHDFLLGEFTKKEMISLKKVFKITNEAIETIITQGKYTAMNKFN